MLLNFNILNTFFATFTVIDDVEIKQVACY